MKERPFSLLAEFASPEALISAVRAARKEGYRKIEAYAPFPVHGLSEAMEFKDTLLPRIVLAGGIVGCLGGFFLQYYASVIAYPLNVGGKPLNSWPAFVPVMFEMTVLFAALSAVLGMLALNGLPMPHHPLFNVDEFEGASRDRFFLSIRVVDRKFDGEGTRRFLEGLKPLEIHDVAW